MGCVKGSMRRGHSLQPAKELRMALGRKSEDLKIAYPLPW